jgi:glycerol kinase
MKYILSIDQGTTGTTACLVDIKNFSLIGKVNKEYPQIYPKPSWVEHNLNDIWSTVEYTVSEVLKKCNVSSSQIASIGITNQRETTCAFQKDGTPLSNAIVWQDRRTSEYCHDLNNKKLASFIKEKTGLPIDPYFSSTKMRWLLKNNPLVQDASKKENLLFGNIDTFLLYKLTGRTSFKTDASNASRTMLMNLKTGKWDKELLDLFEINESTLPTIENSFGIFGHTKDLKFLPDGIPISGILGDQQAALFGQAGFSKGDMKCTYGTGAFVLLNTGTNLIYSNNGLLSTALYQHNGVIHYALEGSSYIAGAAVQWLRDNLKIIHKSFEVEGLAREVKNLNELEHILFFPFFSGIGSPHWNAEAKGAIVGLTRDTNSSHLAFATLEGIALSINDLLMAMKSDTNLPITNLKVDGGAVENNLLMELQASFSETTIMRPAIIETTAFGAALASAVGSGIVEIDQLATIWKPEKNFAPEAYLAEYCLKKKSYWQKTLNKIFM